MARLVQGGVVKTGRHTEPEAIMGGKGKCWITVDLTAIEIERRLTAIETALPTFATKADIQSLRAEIQASRAEWKADLHSLTRWMVDCRAGFGNGRGNDHRANRSFPRRVKRHDTALALRGH